MELEHLDVFLDDMRSSAILLIPYELLVGLDNVRQFVGEIVLGRCSTWYILKYILLQR